MNEKSSTAGFWAGLGEDEAQARLEREGFNELPRTRGRTPFRIVLEMMREPMLMLLLGGGMVYLALGDLQESIILLVFGIASIVITVVQETRTERVLEALRDLTSPRALVIRGGERRPPRSPEEPLFSGALMLWSVLQGILAFGFVAPIYVMAFRRGMPETEDRALAFFSLVTAILAIIFVNRSFSASVLTAVSRPNRALAFVFLGVTAILAVTLMWPVARNLFGFGPLHADDLALTVAAGILVLCILELLKAAWHLRLRA